MEVYLKDLAKMGKRERNRTLNEMVRSATAHRRNGSWLTQVLQAIRGVVQPRRASR